MTTIGTRADSDEFASGPSTTYDLIICHGDRIVFHDHYESPEFRLRVCVTLLVDSDLVSRAIDVTGAMQIRDLYQDRVTQWSTAPDSVVDAIAELCRGWGVQIYVSTTAKRIAAPAALFSVITQYGPGQTDAEHFPTKETRRAGLVERADQFFSSPGCIPDVVLLDEQRLAALVATFLMPAIVILTEASLDEADGVYKPSGPPLPIR